MANYTKEFWNEYNKNRSRASQYTKDFIKEMKTNPTLKHRKNIEFDLYYMVTGFVCYDKADMRRMASRDNIIG
jgi:Tfp pilus assembly protein PilV